MVAPTLGQILNEPAGSRLNMWVGEYVLKLKIDKHRPGNYLKENRSYGMKNFSGDIAAAFEMEEVMSADEWFWRYSDNIKKILLARMPQGVNEFDMLHCSAEVRCKAALLTMLDCERGL